MKTHSLGVYALLLAILGLLPPAPSLLPQESEGAACVGHLDGSSFPELVPPQSLWSAFWTMVDQLDGDPAKAAAAVGPMLGIDSATAHALVRQGAFLRARLTALRLQAARGDPPPSGQATPEAILEARDDLIRTISEPEFRRLQQWTDSEAQHIQYSFGRIGKLVASRTEPGLRCHVSVSGKTHPELIPESFVWEAYFRARSSIARFYMIGGSDYKPENLPILQRNHLPIPDADVQTVLEIAVQATALVDAQRSRPPAGSDGLVRKEIADIVLSARAQLLRRLSKMSWLAVKHDADEFRAASLFDFPTS